MVNLKVVTILSVLLAAMAVSACDQLSRPSQDEIRSCLVASGGVRVRLQADNALAAAIGIYNYGKVPNPTITQLEFGTTISSPGGPIETSIGAPSGTKIFPIRIHISESPQAPAYWVFKDSFGKLRCTEPPGQ